VGSAASQKVHAAWDVVTASPLSWPVGWTRTEAHRRKRAQFGPTSVAVATTRVLRELGRLGVRNGDVVVSTNVALRLDGLPRSNQPKPSDPGAAVYFALKRRPLVLACDRWLDVEHNLVAIAKHVEALRGQERWGVGSVEQAFSGYVQLPAPGAAPSRREWWQVLGFPSAAGLTVEAVDGAYRALAKHRHPDVPGGSQEAFVELDRARDAAHAALKATGGRP
jgi:hypothetical protein